jgi:AcrR family transcriptional regulator
VPSEPGLRERRREATLAEIEQIAMRQLVTAGPAGLSLRAVAREVGVSVQALYHYFPSRDALITALVTDAHRALAAAVAQEAARRTGATFAERFVAVGLAYRRWAAEHRGPFLLAYGTPLPDYHAPVGGPTTAAAAELGAVMRDVVFAGWTPEELQRVPVPPDAPAALTERLALVGAQIGAGLPAGAMAVFLTSWAQLHGLVMLDVLDHMPWLAPHQEGLYAVALGELAQRVEALRHGPNGP